MNLEAANLRHSGAKTPRKQRAGNARALTHGASGFFVLCAAVLK
jgi:hypothetical protein